jgi:hypothetical protein
MMTDHELEEIRRRADAATPGAWDWCPIVDHVEFYVHSIDAQDGIAGYVYTEEDANFISHARKDIQNLLEEVAYKTRRQEELADHVRYLYETVQSLRSDLYNCNGTLKQVAPFLFE